MPDDPLRVTLKLEGPLVDAHRLPLSELQRVTRVLRVTLRDIAIVLSDYGPSGTGGRAKAFIEESVDLVVVGAPQAGSFLLDMEAPIAGKNSSPEQIELVETYGPHLGNRSVRALIAGVEALDDQTERLPEGFDRGVLKSIEGFRTTLNRGVTGVVLSTPEDSCTGTMRLDRPKLDVAKNLVKRPYRSHTVVEGSLRMVDDATLECRIETAGEASVTCYFKQSTRDVVWDAGHGRKYVRVTGEGVFFPGERRPRQLFATSIVVTHEALPFDPEVFWEKSSLQSLADAQRAQPVVSPYLDDPWRDDAEAEALVAAINGE